MLYLHFLSMTDGSSVLLGPSPLYRIVVRRLYEGPGFKLVGMLSRHQWEVQAGHFVRFDCRSPSLIHFEDAKGQRSEDYGPFRHVHLPNGALYADNQLFAIFNEAAELWRCSKSGESWPIVVIKSPQADQAQAQPSD